MLFLFITPWQGQRTFGQPGLLSNGGRGVNSKTDFRVRSAAIFKKTSTYYVTGFQAMESVWARPGKTMALYYLTLKNDLPTAFEVVLFDEFFEAKLQLPGRSSGKVIIRTATQWGKIDDVPVPKIVQSTSLQNDGDSVIISAELSVFSETTKVFQSKKDLLDKFVAKVAKE